MSRDTRNSIRIFHKQKDGKEIIKRIYPNPPVDWRSFCYENAYNYISIGTVYTHDSINNEQWKTLAKLSKKYNLREKVIGG